jgi:MFS transporter, DHA1 family, tetracycline resistance protein
MIYLVRRFSLDTVYIGYLLGSYGAATMISEGFLVRIIVPRLGERTTIRIGLIAFAGQCVLFGVAYKPEHIWISIFLSLFSNLVYPSLSSLVSSSVPSHNQVS